MRIGVPKEIKVLEGRVALIPEAVAELVSHRHEVFVQSGAGDASGYADADYMAAGAQVPSDAAALYSAAEMIVKVKEPQAAELALLRADHLLFSYLHLAAEPALTQSLRDIGLTGVAFETVTDHGRLPLLAPMSDIAGRIAVQVGSHLLHRPQGGKGILLGGLPAAERGQVVILGGGVAGGASAALAAAMGAQVIVFDRDRDKLERMRALGNNVTALYPYRDAMRKAVLGCDLLVGAVLVVGAKAPHLIDADTVRQMAPGSVIVDISVDQGGCIETTRPTSYAEPSYQWEGVTHFAVTNMPGAVPRTASQALCAAITPYVLRLAAGGWEQSPDLAAGVNVRAGKLVHPALQCA